MTAVKVCGLTNLEDARWAWQCGADLLGFIFVRSSPRYIVPMEAARITRALVAQDCRARFVGVFANESIETVNRIVSECSLHLVQLHGGEKPDYARALDIPVIIARRVQEHVPWDELALYEAWGHLLDTHDPLRLGGTGRTWRWDLLAGVSRGMARLVIAGGLTPDNVGLAIRQARPWGVDVSSGVEARPGRKDPSLVELFVQRVREEDRA